MSLFANARCTIISLFLLTYSVAVFPVDEVDKAKRAQKQERKKRRLERHQLNSDLATAVERGDIPVAQEALEEGADPNIRRGSALLEAGGEFIPHYGESPTMIQTALLLGDLHMVQFLSGVARFNPTGLPRRSRGSLLNFAIPSGNLELVEWLVAKGADMLAPSGTLDQRPIDVALVFDQMPIFQYLLEHGAVIAGGPLSLIGQIISASWNQPDQTIIRSIDIALENGYDINAHFDDPSPLWLAIKYKKHGGMLLQWLIEQGAAVTTSVNKLLALRKKDDIFENPLLDAIAFGRFDEASKILTELKNKTRLSGSNEFLIAAALGLASAQGFTPVVLEILARFSTDLHNRQIFAGALLRAARNGHSDVVQAIFENQSGAIEHNIKDWRQDLSRALRLAAL